MTNACGNLDLFTLNELNLIPEDLILLSPKEQCKMLSKNTATMAKLRCQIYTFLFVLKRAKRYENLGKCFCPYKIPWKLLENNLTLNGPCLAKYYDYAVCNANTGFAFLMFKVYKIFKNEENCRNMIQDGKATCNLYQTWWIIVLSCL